VADNERNQTISKTTHAAGPGLSRREEVPVLLVAAFPGDQEPTPADRCRITPPFTVGRGSKNVLAVNDRKMSKRHFRITHKDRSYWLEDIESTNGTFVNGEQTSGRHKLNSPCVVRAGESVFSFHADGKALLDPTPAADERHGMAGRFHVAPLVVQLREAALSDRHVLLVGPSGVGKELAAGALAQMWEMEPPLAHNSARSASEQETGRILFGVAEKAFTGVAKRDGLIVNAHKTGRPLFLDEVHHLPPNVQGVLLRVIEERQLFRTGDEGSPIEIDVRFIFASNTPEKLAYDLRARLRTVSVPPLRERVADVPVIFDHLLRRQLTRQKAARDNSVLDGLQPQDMLEGDHSEELCLEALSRDGFPGDQNRIRRRSCRSRRQHLQRTLQDSRGTGGFAL
jgi:transcriptional regulator of acetoin/glycerol metabolism